MGSIKSVRKRNPQTRLVLTTHGGHRATEKSIAHVPGVASESRLVMVLDSRPWRHVRTCPSDSIYLEMCACQYRGFSV